MTPLNALSSTAYPYQFAIAITGYHGTGGTWSPTLDSSISALNPAPAAGGDVVTIRHIDGPGAPLIAAMANSSADLQVGPSSQLAAGDVLIVADCTTAAIFNATSFDSTSGTVGHEAPVYPRGWR